MKRRFWISGKDQRQRGWLAWLAFPGLIAAYVYGVLILVPQVDAGAIEAFATQAAPASIIVPEQIEPTAVDPIGVEPMAIEPSGTEPVLVEPDIVVAMEAAESAAMVADPCLAAMDAALSNARIEFLSSSVEIVSASRNVISVLAALAHACPGQIVIAGHSDNLGPEAANLQISLARAESVADTFVEFGLDPDRLSVQRFGSAQPIADNNTRAGRARNRRIEMSLLTEDPPVQGE